MRPLEHQPLTDETQVQLVPRRESKRPADLSGNHETALLPQHQCGIHEAMVSHAATVCHTSVQIGMLTSATEPTCASTCWSVGSAFVAAEESQLRLN